MSRFYISVVERTDPVALDDAWTLFEAYAEWLGDLEGTTTVAAETLTLPAPYESPGGVLLLARDDSGRAIGIVGIREQSGTSCEIKRLFVRAEARGHGLGRALTRAALDHARALGYTECYLTTVPGVMDGALRMYRSLGFVETEQFRDFSHLPDDAQLVFFRRSL
jgi:GNAT superfamily N-acetyltransferase